MGLSSQSVREFSDSLRVALETHLQELDGHPKGNLQHIVVSAVEEKLAHFAMRECNGNVSEAARVLGISRTTLARKLNGELSSKYGKNQKLGGKAGTRKSGVGARNKPGRKARRAGDAR